MLRVAALCAIAGAVLLLAGCAYEVPSAPSASARTQAPRSAAPVVIKTRTCETTFVQDNMCAEPKTCPNIATCAEANYFLRVCGHPLDMNRNRVPCEVKCGKSREDMEAQIKKEGGPFVPRRSQVGERVCSNPV
jgi:hypothetical protein